MVRSLRVLLFCLGFYGLTAVSAVAAPKTELLWPDGAPGAKGDAAKDKPTLTIYAVDEQSASGTGVVIFPGGGYGHLATDHEGHQIARWLNGLGISAFICEYRHRGKGYGHPAPLQDAQRAIRLVRSRAKEFHVKPDQIGVIGFSAGGHLASSTATHFDAGDSSAADPIDQAGCRPDFAVLCYPVISLVLPSTHSGSRRNLLGDTPDPELVKKMSSELQVTKQTPPVFLFHTSEDTGVKPENSIVFYQACIKAGVPAEMHIYQSGRHGLGLAKNVAGTSDWPARCATWMAARGLIAKQPSN